MTLKLYNTLSRSLEEFIPITAGKAGLYTCGPTVYNFAHIGNFRAYIFEDVLRRTLEHLGFAVTQVMNLTDVDDKTIRDSQAAGHALGAFTAQFKEAFFDDLKTLRVAPAEHYPAATEHIPEMIALVQRLLDNGYAYVGDDGSVYFSIAKFSAYGRLARVDLTAQRQGDRVKADEYGKEAVADFALWKRWSEEDGEVGWESPWGRGRPGWHIECSAMSMKYLGPHFDIHTGGIDNMFPHHEDEIAQSEAATGETFVNYWLHCEHLQVDGEKMSKTLGNFYTLRDLLDRGWTGREVRWLLLSAHYRQRLNFTMDGLSAARTVLRRIDDFVRRLWEEREAAGAEGRDAAARLAEQATNDFAAALADDLNMPNALAAFFCFMHDANRALDDGTITGDSVELLLDTCRALDQVLAVIDVDAGESAVPAEILARVEARQQARRERDFARADALRDEIAAAGWRVEDTPKGPRVVPA